MQHHPSTSKSALMHASLAFLSPEIQTMDSIIRTSPILMPILPTEILLLVRESLFPLIMTQLVQKSTAALEAYEHSLRNLLCPDCIVYNLDIYGPNIWHWEQFHGPCACLQVESLPSSIRSSPQLPSTSTPNPKQFKDAQHWLEEHLSRDATVKLLIKSHELHPTQSLATSTISPGAGETTIWDVISFVLQEYGCEFVRVEPEEPASKFIRHADRTHFRVCDVVQIVPVNKISAESRIAQGRSWHAVQELCLDSIEPFGAHSRDPSSFKRLLWYPNSRTVQGQDHVQVIFGVVASMVAGCLFLPITCTTIAISIFYFYSRPRSCKIF